jgi:hypothetical protein
VLRFVLNEKYFILSCKVTVRLIRPWPLPSKLLPVHHPLVILPFDPILSQCWKHHLITYKKKIGSDVFGHEWCSIYNDAVSSVIIELFSFSFLSMSVQSLDVQVTALCHSIRMNNMYFFFHMKFKLLWICHWFLLCTNINTLLYLFTWFPIFV